MKLNSCQRQILRDRYTNIMIEYEPGEKRVELVDGVGQETGGAEVDGDGGRV